MRGIESGSGGVAEMGANAFLLAQRYAAGAEGSGAAVLGATAASLVTLSAWLTWLR
jgi:hypothetical protein